MLFPLLQEWVEGNELIAFSGLERLRQTEQQLFVTLLSHDVEPRVDEKELLDHFEFHLVAVVQQGHHLNIFERHYGLLLLNVLHQQYLVDILQIGH